MLSICAADTALAQATDSTNYVGEWVRATTIQNFVVFLAVSSRSAGELSVQAWGRCRLNPESGGTKRNCEFWGTATAELDGTGTARLYQPKLREHWQLQLSDGRLWIRVPNSEVDWTRDPGVDLVRVRRGEVTTQPDNGRCTIVGQISGPLSGLLHSDILGVQPTSVSLEQMWLTRPGQGTHQTTPIRNRQFRFPNLQAGVEYRVSPPWQWQSEPRFVDVSCKANLTHHLPFRIIGTTPGG